MLEPLPYSDFKFLTDKEMKAFSMRYDQWDTMGEIGKWNTYCMNLKRDILKNLISKRGSSYLG